jgi:hypothetical protein
MELQEAVEEWVVAKVVAGVEEEVLTALPTTPNLQTISNIVTLMVAYIPNTKDVWVLRSHNKLNTQKRNTANSDFSNNTFNYTTCLTKKLQERRKLVAPSLSLKAQGAPRSRYEQNRNNKQTDFGIFLQEILRNRMLQKQKFQQDRSDGENRS